MSRYEHQCLFEMTEGDKVGDDTRIVQMKWLKIEDTLRMIASGELVMLNDEQNLDILKL
jgi:hypothetical protein